MELIFHLTKEKRMFVQVLKWNLIVFWSIAQEKRMSNFERQSSNITNDKSAKYDRQLRLWGNHGQDNLENSRICLINATAAGTETLKNMVLPGVGYFTILDETSISEEDLANKWKNLRTNHFLSKLFILKFFFPVFLLHRKHWDK